MDVEEFYFFFFFFFHFVFRIFFIINENDKTELSGSMD